MQCRTDSTGLKEGSDAGTASPHPGTPLYFSLGTQAWSCCQDVNVDTLFLGTCKFSSLLFFKWCEAYLPAEIGLWKVILICILFSGLLPPDPFLRTSVLGCPSGFMNIQCPEADSTVVVTKIIHKVAVLFHAHFWLLGEPEGASRVVIGMSCSRKSPEDLCLPISSPLTLPLMDKYGLLWIRLIQVVVLHLGSLLNEEDQMRMRVIRNFGEQFAFPCFFSSETLLFFVCTRTGLVLETTLWNRKVFLFRVEHVVYQKGASHWDILISFLKCEVLLSRARLFATPRTVAQQALSMGFSRREYWSGLPFPSPGDLPNPGSKPGLLHYRQILSSWSP